MKQKNGDICYSGRFDGDFPTKEVADEVWLISTTDTDLLEQKCREVGLLL